MVIIISGALSLFPYLDIVRGLLIGMTSITHKNTVTHTILTSLAHKYEVDVEIYR